MESREDMFTITGVSVVLKLDEQRPWLSYRCNATRNVMQKSLEMLTDFVKCSDSDHVLFVLLTSWGICQQYCSASFLQHARSIWFSSSPDLVSART